MFLVANIAFPGTRFADLTFLISNPSIFYGIVQQLMLALEKKLQQSKTPQNKKSYLKYTVKMRLELIKLVCQQNFSTAEAARLIGIKQTSACRIMASYRNHNRIFQRKTDRLLRQKCQTLEEMQKTHGNQEKTQLKYEENQRKDEGNPTLCQKTEEKESDPEIEKVNSKLKAHQLIIPTPYLPQVNHNQQYSCNAFIYGQNPLWNWPLYFQYY